MSYFGELSGVISLLAFIFYFTSIITKKTIPSRVTWMSLSIIGLLILLSSYSAGHTSTIWFQLSYLVGPFLIFLLSIKYGEGGFSRVDLLCLSTSFISICLWLITDLPVVALVLNILADFFAIFPTIHKSYLKPDTESALPWIITCIASLLALLSVENWIFIEYLYPIYMVFFNTLIALIIVRKKLGSYLIKVLV